MKNRWWIVIIGGAILLLWIIVGLLNAGDQKKAERLLFQMLELEKGQRIIIDRDVDIDGNDSKEKIVVYGNKRSKDSMMAQNINIALIDSSGENVKKTDIVYLSGIEPVIYVGDFTGDGIKDVFISVLDANTVTTKNAVVNFSDGEPKYIFTEQHSGGTILDCVFKDDFLMEINVIDKSDFLSVDLSKDKEMLIKNGYFDEEGKVIYEKELKALSFGMLQPVDMDGDGIYELRGGQRIVDKENNELISIISMLKFDQSGWVLKRIEYGHMIKNY